MKSCPTCQRTYADELAFCPLDAQPLQSSVAPLVGQVFDGKYEIEALIALTRTSQLYRARHIHLGDRAALMIFHPELCDEVAEWLRRFYRELQASLRFCHPNAVTVYYLRTSADGLSYLVVEYVEGHSLDRELRQRGRFTPLEVFAVLEPVASALAAARDFGLTCDFLTPADIMLARTGNDLLSVKLLPLIFNQRFIEDMLSEISTAAGSDTRAVAAPYIAPKLWSDDTPPAGESDAIYSLGVIAYELLSGQKPYDGLTPREIAVKQATGQFAPLAELAPEIPAPVARVVERALAKEEKDRPATVGEFVTELRDALGMNVRAMESQLKMAGAAEQIPDAAQILAKKRLSGLEIERESRRSESSSERLRRLEIELESYRSKFSSKEATVTDKPLYKDENVQFTVYQPEAIAPARWYTLLAFAHLSKRRPDAPPDEPEPLAEVKRLAERVLADERADYDAVKQNSLHAVPHKGEITFVPEIAGCEFNPPGLTFSWQKSVHKVEFEIRAAAALDGQTARGRLTVFLGSLILADVPLSIRVESAASAWSAGEVPTVPVSAAPYRKIFPSYSHMDRAIVEQIEHHVHSLGDKYLRDVTELRAGQDWQRWMREAIEEADMFQLFWSHNSMRSVYVRQEWEYALSLGRPNFIRPTYWEEPLPESPAENLPPAELRQLHFTHLRANPGTDRTTPTVLGSEQVPTEQPGRVEASGDTQPAGAGLCSGCGTRNAAEVAFCPNCGTALGATAPLPTQSTPNYAQPTATFAQQSDNAPDVSRHEVAESAYRKHAKDRIAQRGHKEWVRQSSQSYAKSRSPQSPAKSRSPRSGGGESPNWLGLLLIVLLLLGIVSGIYQLISFL